ncbi:uncharacterized protein [Miscanthus floridulus]|uniref:uncharacterized protein isoform X2 n=1 Tax=Miscanthus floridulus TaxID=154761 RepID=UPI003457EE02
MMRPAGGASEVMNWISPHPAMQDATHTTCSVPAFSHKGRRYLVGLYDWNSAWMEWTVKRISPQYLVPLPPEQQSKGGILLRHCLVLGNSQQDSFI